MTVTRVFIAGILFATTYSQTLCGDYQECLDSFFVTRQSIECGGYESCKSSTSSQAKIISSGNRGYVCCSGENSCFTNPFLASRNNNLYCSGKQGCTSSSVMKAEAVKCSGQYACRYGKIVAERTISCGGVSTCYGAEKQAYRIYCGGYFGCSSGPVRADQNVRCDSSVSCGGTGSKVTAQGSITCTGSFSCPYGDRTAGNSISLYGSRAGFGITITDTPLIELYGNDALAKGIMDSGSLSQMTVEAYFYSTIFDRNVLVPVNDPENYLICRNGATCTLKCKSNACRNIIYRCENGATCNVEPSECTAGAGNKQQLIDGIRCPKMEYVNGVAVLPSINYDDDEYPENPEDKKMEDVNADVTTYCNLEDECVGDTVALSGFEGLFCRGVNSCGSVTVDSDTTGTVSCGGEGSCSDGDISTNGEIQCNGVSSCDGASLATVIGKAIECTGELACKDANLLLANNGGNSNWDGIACEAGRSCQGANITAYGESYIDCEGVRACEGSMITTEYAITCKSDYSCQGSEISINWLPTNYPWFTCSGRGSCSDSVINLSEGKIQAGAFLSLARSSVYGGDIEAYGYRSIAFSTIYSDVGTPALYQLYGNVAGLGATIICRDECVLRCEGTGCKNLDYVCVGNSQCTISPSQCLQPGSGRYMGVVCPNQLVQLENDEEVQEFLAKKKMEIENNEDYKEISAQILMDKEEFEVLQISYDETEGEVLFDGELNIMEQAFTNDNEVVIEITAAVFIFGCVYLLYRNMCYNKGYQSLE